MIQIENVNLYDAVGFTPIAIGAKCGHHKVVKRLASFSDLSFRDKNGIMSLVH
jgi:hypothetical protein